MATEEFDYKKYFNLVLKRKKLFLIVSLTVMTIAVIVSYALPRKYEAKSTVFIEKSVIGDLVKGIAVTPSIEDKVKVLTYAITSRTLLVKVIDELDLNAKRLNEAQIENLIKEIQDNLVVKLRDKEGLFIIAFQDKSPRIARDFVNTLVRRYIEENTSYKREDSYGANKFLAEQIKTFKEKLDKAETEVNNFKRERGALAGMDPSTLQKENTAAQQRIDEIRIKRSQLESWLANQKKSSPLSSKLSALQKRLEELQLQYTDSYPEVARIKAEIEATKSQLKTGRGPEDFGADGMEVDKVNAEIRALRQAEDNLRGSIAANRGMMSSIPAFRAQLENLERDKITQKAMYDQLTTRQGQSEVSQQMEVQDKSTNFRIVDAAVMPIKPVSPNRLRIMLIGILGGLAAGMGILLGLDNLNRCVKSVNDIKHYGLPVLAVIPKMQNPLELAINRKKDIRLFCFAGVYFCFILSFLAMEALQLSFIDRMLDSVQLVEGIKDLKHRVIK